MKLVRKLYIGRNEQLDELARTAGELYTQTMVTFWRIQRKQGLFLSSGSMEKICNSKKMHAHTADAVVQSFYSALKSYYSRKEVDPKARPPRTQRKYYAVQWKQSAIKVKNGKLILSNGKGNEPLIIPWRRQQVPVFVTMTFQHGQYILLPVYTVDCITQPIGNKIAAIDLGEIHAAAIYDGEKCYLLNGRLLRSIKRQRNKLIGKMQKKLSTKTKGSRQDKKQRASLKKQLRKLDNQKHDILHKQTTEAISTLFKNGVQTLVIGDIRDLRRNGKVFHKKSSQKIHQMSSGEVRHLLTYKAELAGMNVTLINEAYTSQECPRCNKRTKPTNRNFKCRFCKSTFHRDIVGAFNIRKKYLGKGQVVGVMASPISLRYSPHMKCSL
jgi:putative transposase